MNSALLVKENILKMIGKENNIVIAGLGNPGQKYENTYHNLGFMVIDAMVKKTNLKKSQKECQAEVYTIFKGDAKVILAKPQTFMNLSGDSIKELSGKYLNNLDNLIIVYDDIDIPEGTLRVRESGSAGTHNGMKSIVEKLGCKNFKRVRVGFGGETDIPLISKVLSKLNSKKDRAVLEAVDKISDLLIDYIDNLDFNKLMRGANQK